MAVKLPGTPVITGLFVIVGIMVAYLAFNLVSIPVRDINTSWAEHLDASTINFPNTTAVEENWLNEFNGQSSYVPAPLGPLPCPRYVSGGAKLKNQVQAALDQAQAGQIEAAIQALQPLATSSKAHWLPVLSLSILQARAGQGAAARAVLDKFFASETNQKNIGLLYEFRRRRVPIVIAGRRVIATEEHLRAFVHMSYNRSALWLQQGQYGRKTLKILRRSVGLSKQLFNWSSNEGDVQEALIPAPGCTQNKQGLTTTDIYNNLIVGYLLSDTFKSTRASLKREARRRYTDSAGSNPLYAPLVQYRGTRSAPQNWVWALSNAEHITHSIPRPANPILSYNLATLMNSIIERGYAPKDALAAKRMQLLNAIQWQQVPKAEKALIMPSAVREFLAHNQPIPPNMLQHMDPQYSSIIAARRFSATARTNNARRQEFVNAIVAGREQPIHEGLGARAEDWLRGMRSDLAQHLAYRCLDIEDAVERQRLANAITLFRRAGDAPVPDLAMCRVSGGSVFLQMMPDWLATREGNWGISIFFAAIGAFLVWLVWLWVKARMRQRQILFTNLYGLEAKSL